MGTLCFHNLYFSPSFVIPADPGSGPGQAPESSEGVVNRQPAVYILASRRNGTLYVGVTSDLIKRIWEHKNSMVEGFTKRYGVRDLVWYELHETMESAITREKRLKDWKRDWKLALIESTNPDWRDLSMIRDCLTGFRLPPE